MGVGGWAGESAHPPGHMPGDGKSMENGCFICFFFAANENILFQDLGRALVGTLNRSLTGTETAIANGIASETANGSARENAKGNASGTGSESGRRGLHICVSKFHIIF